MSSFEDSAYKHLYAHLYIDIWIRQTKGWATHQCLPGLDWGEYLDTREEKELVILEAGTVQNLDHGCGYMMVRS